MDVKQDCAQHEPTAPLSPLVSLSGEAFLLSEWKILAKACLTRGLYLL